MKLTLVSRPLLDSGFGDELVRENVTAYLRAGKADGTKKGFLKSEFSKVDGVESEEEKDLLKEAISWNPVKVTQAKLQRTQIVGSVYLEIEYQSRDGMEPNYDGVPFAAILTISDPKGEAPVNAEMKSIMNDVGVRLSDIEIAARVRGQIG